MRAWCDSAPDPQRQLEETCYTEVLAAVRRTCAAISVGFVARRRAGHRPIAELDTRTEDASSPAEAVILRERARALAGGPQDLVAAVLSDVTTAAARSGDPDPRRRSPRSRERSPPAWPGRTGDEFARSPARIIDRVGDWIPGRPVALPPLRPLARRPSCTPGSPRPARLRCIEPGRPTPIPPACRGLRPKVHPRRDAAGPTIFKKTPQPWLPPAHAMRSARSKDGTAGRCN